MDISNIDWHINWTEFHFIRPKVLYLLYVLGFIVLLLIIGNRENGKWKKVIAAHLRPFMFVKGSRWSMILPLLFFVVGCVCAIMGVAGPTWKKKTIPGQKIQAVVLVALDVSKSMLATDIQPTRLDRAKLKISDFLAANPKARAGLLAYAGTPHLVLPFTSDYKIIRLHANSLENREMPVQGSNTKLLFQEIDTLMQPVLAPSTVLVMTDEITAEDAAYFTNYVNANIHSMEVLLVSSPGGAAVPGFKGVHSQQDPAILKDISNHPKITITPMTLDTTDVGGIAKRISDHLVFEKDKKQDDKEWDDMGFLLIIPTIVIALFWFRRGWQIQWLLLLPVLTSSCSVNSKEADWWYSKDYQGQVLSHQHHYNEAAAHYTDDQRKAIAYFKAGDFVSAEALFALDTSATGTYNHGLALAKLGRYDEAMDAFSHAESLDSTLKVKVKQNFTKAQHAKEEVDSLASLKQPAKDLHEKKDKKDPLKEHKPASEDEKLASETKVDKMPKNGDRATETVKSNIHRAQEAEQPDGKKPQKEDPDQAVKDIIMRKPPADPGEFLHKRFVLQKNRYYKHVQQGKEAW
ncbi:VWA domain-containing protein [Chitinophaga skermanii]|nr:VWA domain-containing protein [Chitinophaga skermanii]